MKQKPYCDVFEGDWFIAQKNGLNLSMNTKDAAETMLRLESENARLKALVGDVWNYVPMPDTLRKDFITKEHYEQLEARIKKEGII